MAERCKDGCEFFNQSIVCNLNFELDKKTGKIINQGDITLTHFGEKVLSGLAYKYVDLDKEFYCIFCGSIYKRTSSNFEKVGEAYIPLTKEDLE